MFSEFEFWLRILFLLALGGLGASSVIVKKKPDAKELLDKLAKYGGIIGIISVLWGAWDLITAIRFISFIRFAGLMWLTLLVSAAVLLGLGFIFGYGMATAYMSEEAKAKGEQLRQKLAGYQIPLGWLSLILAVWWLVYRFIIV